MSEFPALRDALVSAGLRRRRRRRVIATTPVFAVVAALVALFVVPRAPRERERTVTPPVPTPTVVKPYAEQTLEEAFAVFRRKQTRADRMPDVGGLPGQIDAKRTRLLKQGGPRLYFAAPVSTRDGESVCIVAIRRGRVESAGCTTAASAIDEATPLRFGFGDVTSVFLPDSSTDLRFITANSIGSVSERNNLSSVLLPQQPLSALAWTGGSGTRYIEDLGRPKLSMPPPATCPERLDPLPADALAKARRRALIAIDSVYPRVMRGTVSAAARATDTPCPTAITERAIEVTLRLVARDGASVSEGRLLLGMQDGYMRVFYALR
ncbi:hypothetical protein [Solirubrobacter soli]|uniref:hypothetical protein n=1 Tax=Solirubrobacter soli TaxID=363832 RepID=UPI0003FD6C60|nr:hypothetical protein [Solirubrobacter soli]